MSHSSHVFFPPNSLCVIGHPIAHSLSPLMHTTAFRALGLDWTYTAVDVEPSSLTETVRGFAERGLAGFNVTIPHKESILALLDEVDSEARAIGAVNTVKIDGGKMKGWNTDVHGILQSLDPFRNEIERKNVVVIGTGGAARAVIHTLMNHFNVSGLCVVSRSEPKAQDFVLRLARSTNPRKFIGVGEAFSGLTRILYDATLIVNATPQGMSPRVDESPLGEDVRFHRGQIVFDLIYTPLKTKLLERAEAHGAQIVSGLEMFLHQGAKASEIWTGKKMPVEVVRPVMESALQSR